MLRTKRIRCVRVLKRDQTRDWYDIEVANGAPSAPVVLRLINEYSGRDVPSEMQVRYAERLGEALLAQARRNRRSTTLKVTLELDERDLCTAVCQCLDDNYGILARSLDDFKYIVKECIGPDLQQFAQEMASHNGTSYFSSDAAYGPFTEEEEVVVKEIVSELMNPKKRRKKQQ